MKPAKFYVTTPIYYVTAKPHLGSLYSTLIADVAARWNKLLGKKVFFLTGTDEHGQKVAQAAEKVGMDPKTFVDSFIPAYKDLWHKFKIDYTEFIRTTDEYHVKAVQKWLSDLMKKGDIYKGCYQGWYCTQCEAFVTQKDNEDGLKLEQGVGPHCPNCSRQTHWVSEETYFFSLSAYQGKLLELYKNNPDFIVPKERAQEVINFVESGLKDLSISRTTVRWGIPFPGDPKHVTYVWADALNNYITAIGYGDPNKQKEFEFWWPADLQVMGKDIIRFHAVYWPAFLMASDLEVPKQLLVHGWIKVDEQKMSKSLGNVIDPQDLYAQYGADPVRYYLMRKMAITHDSSFSTADLEQTITTDLANDLGNLLNRLIVLAHKFDAYEIQAPKTWQPGALKLRDECLTMIETFATDMYNCSYHMALSNAWRFIHQINTYFHSNEPWRLAASDRNQFLEILSATAHSLNAVGMVLWPFMPKKMEQLLDALSQTLKLEKNNIQKLELGTWDKRFMLKKIDPLFEKYESKTDASGQPELKEIKPQETESSMISIDDFIKVELVVGTIDQCEEVPGSDKLLKLQVDFGHRGIRQILSGVRKSFTCQDLIGQQAVFVFNLKPRKMMGMDSNGMLLTAQDPDGKQKIITPAGAVTNGTQLK